MNALYENLINFFLHAPFLTVVAAVSTGIFARYLTAAGIPFLILFKIKPQRFSSHMIQKRVPDNKLIRQEFLSSLQSMLIFCIIAFFAVFFIRQGMTQIYFNFSDHSIFYFAFSVVLTLLVNETYFYFAHKIMHQPKFYKATHAYHHKFINPTPLAAFSFSWIEAVLQGSLIFPIIMLFPIHPYAVFIWGTVNTLFNIMGHLGYEFAPKSHEHHWFWKHICTSTHHNNHHRYFNYNYGFIFTFWDKLLHTDELPRKEKPAPEAAA